MTQTNLFHINQNIAPAKRVSAMIGTLSMQE